MFKKAIAKQEQEFSDAVRAVNEQVPSKALRLMVWIGVAFAAAGGLLLPTVILSGAGFTLLLIGLALIAPGFYAAQTTRAASSDERQPPQ